MTDYKNKYHKYKKLYKNLKNNSNNSNTLKEIQFGSALVPPVGYIPPCQELRDQLRDLYNTYSGLKKKYNLLRNLWRNPKSSDSETIIPRGQFKIIVKTLTGVMMTFLINSYTTVRELQSMIENKHGIPPYQQRFIYNTRQLEVDRVLFPDYLAQCEEDNIDPNKPNSLIIERQQGETFAKYRKIPVIHLILRLVGSDKRLKTNINKIGTSPSGIPIYTFRYKNEKGLDYQPGIVYQGVIAQDLLNMDLKSDIVVKRPEDGMWTVDYNKIDVEFKRIE